MAEDIKLDDIVARKEQHNTVDNLKDRPIIQARTTNFTKENLNSRVELSSRPVLEMTVSNLDIFNDEDEK